MRQEESPRVIVVDDEVTIAATLAIILDKSGFSATHFTNPLDALQSVEIEPLDLLISDVVMPQMSGVDLAISVRRIHPECMVLLFSGQAHSADLLKHARDLGYDFHLLAKPIHPADLLCEVRGLTVRERSQSAL
jgi:DNA-binding NtrC family response regulator